MPFGDLKIVYKINYVQEGESHRKVVDLNIDYGESHGDAVVDQSKYKGLIEELKKIVEDYDETDVEGVLEMKLSIPGFGLEEPTKL